MSRHHRSVRVAVLLLAIQMVAWPGVGHAQGRPSGNSPRLWLEVGVSAGAQARRCVTCGGGTATVGGGSATAAAGVTLPRGFGIGLLGRAFNQFDFESSLQSRYVSVFAQYAPPAVSVLTLNVGGGRGRYSSEPDAASNDGGGTIIYAGAALRVPPRGGLAVSLTADVMQSMDGAPRSRPRLLSVGISLGAATPSPMPQAP
jgi:hypothetical protein